ncbi:trypsin-like peptidase domain-containing protein [Streptomyces niger]|uniref:trypsin-like peptidase domain-containing protein n=1 Tax=Streptomyces niger TaxID=66373 RepID=UPI0006999B9B|nr:trypsin-like peptidase domain-containing protein [Streptomyces niger]
MVVQAADAAEALVRIRDLAGRPRGTGFLADLDGTVLTSHEAVDGLARLVLHGAGGRSCTVGADAVTPLPEAGLALVRTGGLGVPPLPIAAGRPGAGADVRLHADVRPHADGHLRADVRPDAGRPPAAGARYGAADALPGRILGTTAVTYTATDRHHHLAEAIELAVRGPGGEALRLGGPAAGGPVTDAGTGAVLAVIGTALHRGARTVPGAGPVPARTGAAPDGFAIPLHAAAEAGPRGPLAALLARNAATIPAYGPDLNLAGALALTTTAMGTTGGPGPWRDPVERRDVSQEFTAFAAYEGSGACEGSGAYQGTGAYEGSGAHERSGAYEGSGAHERSGTYEGGGFFAGSGTSAVGGTSTGSGTSAGGRGSVPAARVLALVGDPGTGRSTELAALAVRRARATVPAPTVRLRGADLRATDRGLRDAVGRALRSAGRVLSASGPTPGDPAAATPDEVAGLARAAGRPLLVLLDGPEELPSGLSHRLADWTRDTAEWLHGAGAQLLLACRPEFWETAGLLFPAAFLHRPRHPAVTPPGAPAGALPPCVRLGDLPPRQAARARARYGLPAGALTAADAGHPLALRLLAEVRQSVVAAGGDAKALGTPHRHEIFGAAMDLLCLRVAERLAGTAPGERARAEGRGRGAALRRTAARVAGRAHEAARRCLGPGQGELDRASFDELFPWRTGWASAVLAEGLLVPAGAGYRFPHEEFADWLQGAHLDVDDTLDALVHRPVSDRAAPVPATAAPGAGPAPAETDTPVVPRHRIGPVVEALLHLGRRGGPEALGRRLERLVAVVTGTSTTRASSGDAGPGSRPEQGPWPGSGPAGDARWWAEHLLGEVLLRLPDAVPYARVLHVLAARVTDRSALAGGFDRTGLDAFGPWFWERLPLDPATRLDLVRRLLPADGPPPEPAADSGGATAASPPPAPTPTSAPATGTTTATGTGTATVTATIPGEPGCVTAPPSDRPVSPTAPAEPGVRPVPAEPGARVASTGSGARVASAEPGVPAEPGVRVASAGAGAPAAPRPPRFLGLAAALLGADPRRVQPLLCRWFDDERPLQRGRSAVRTGTGTGAGSGSGVAQGTDGAPPQEPTVAAAAQALLHTHRRRATDALTEALAVAAHPRADELLTALAEDEPAALCRAVDRWSRDDRPARRAAAATYALAAAGYAATEADRELLRGAARTLLDRPGDPGVHGRALALLVADRATRSRYLDRALARFTAGDPALPPAAFAAALTSHPEPVLAAFQTRLRRSSTAAGGRPSDPPGPPAPTATPAPAVTSAPAATGIPAPAATGAPAPAVIPAPAASGVPASGAPAPDPEAAADAAEAVLRTLAGISTPALAQRAAALVDEYATRFPWTAARPVADFVAGRLEAGPGARTVLRPLAVRLLTAHAAPVRCALVPVLAGPGNTASHPLRQELLDVLLEREHSGIGRGGRPAAAPDPTVLDALLCAAAQGATRRPEARTRDLVHRTGMLHVRTTEGAARFDRRLVELGRLLPEFAVMVRTWLADAPAEWAAVVGPGARAMLGPRPPADLPPPPAPRPAAPLPTPIPTPPSTPLPAPPTTPLSPPLAPPRSALSSGPSSGPPSGPSSGQSSGQSSVRASKGCLTRPMAHNALRTPAQGAPHPA